MTIPFTNGEARLVEKARNASIEFYGMDGQGATAPGAVVIREFPESYHPFVVHFANTQDGGFYSGDYFETLDEAQECFVQRCTRYDPTGRLNASFNAK